MRTAFRQYFRQSFKSVTQFRCVTHAAVHSCPAGNLETALTHLPLPHPDATRMVRGEMCVFGILPVGSHLRPVWNRTGRLPLDLHWWEPTGWKIPATVGTADVDRSNEFLQHAPCLHEVKDEYEACGRNHQKNIHDITADQNSTNHISNERKVRKLCCSFQEYLQCSQEVVFRKCGEETAKFMEVFFAKMSSSLIQIHCSKYTPGSQLCDEAFSSATPLFSSNFLATLAVSLSILYPLRRCLSL